MHKNTRWQQESLGPNKISPDLVMSSNSLSVLEISTVGACYHRSSTGCHRYLLQAKFRSKSMSIRPWTRSIHFLSGATTATTIAKIISLWTFFFSSTSECHFPHRRQHSNMTYIGDGSDFHCGCTVQSTERWCAEQSGTAAEVNVCFWIFDWITITTNGRLHGK